MAYQVDGCEIGSTQGGLHRINKTVKSRLCLKRGCAVAGKVDGENRPAEVLATQKGTPPCRFGSEAMYQKQGRPLAFTQTLEVQRRAHVTDPLPGRPECDRARGLCSHRGKGDRGRAFQRYIGPCG